MSNRAFKLELRRLHLRKWLGEGMTQLLERVRGGPWGEDVERLSGEVQRFGSQAFRTIVERWPLLAELVRDRKLVSARYQAVVGARSAAAPPAKPEEPALSVQAVGALLAQLMAASAWQSRVSAALSLAHIDAEGVVPGLVRALRDPSVEVAVAAVDALGSHHETASTGALLDVLANEDGYFSPITRVAAIGALARRLRVSELAPISAAVRDLDAEVCIAAIAVLSERSPALATEQLLPILRDRSGFFLPVVRLATANALERCGRLHEALVVDLLAAEADPAVRRVLERAQHFVVNHESTLT